MKKLEAQNAKVLVIGGGGREHAIGLQLQTDQVEKIYFAPGNAGTAKIGKNVELNLKDFGAINDFVKKNEIDLIVVGPEDPLANGIVDYFRAKGVPIVGPTKAAAQIESSKIFARQLMEEADIPQPDFCVCNNEEETKEAISFFGLPVVLKVDGLAAGKGAFVCKSKDDIAEAMKAIYRDKKFGVGPILVEECLEGQEISFFVLCDILNHVVIGTAQDYKRLLDGDQGPNTGGMGSVSPSPLYIKRRSKLMNAIDDEIITPILEMMRQKGHPFTGFLYCGLMIDKIGNPSVIEFNCRLGDPETQVILPLIKNDFFELLWKSVNNDLADTQVSFFDISAVFIVKVAKGYPSDYQKNMTIRIVNNFDTTCCEIIHAGTRLDENRELVTMVVE